MDLPREPTLFDDSRASNTHPVTPNENSDDSLLKSSWLLGLMAKQGIGSARALNVAQTFQSASELISASSEQIQLFTGLKNISFRDLKEYKSNVESDLGIELFSFFDSGYPSGFKDLLNPPAVIWVRGKLRDDNAVTIVGTRHPDPEGLNIARRAALISVENNFSVISGLALGIDAAAHEGALEGNGHTVAIIACDIRFPTPVSHVNLAKEIIASGGALVTEQPLGTGTSPQSLVSRNRLQAAMGNGIFMPECGVPSGTLHTIKDALEMKRPLSVYKSESLIKSPNYGGNLALLSQDASAISKLSRSKKFAEVLASRKTIVDFEIKELQDFIDFLSEIRK
jgi:DNA processing protein